MELFIFHLRVGARIGLRLLAPVLAGLFACYYLLRPEFFVMLGDHIFVRSARLPRGALLALILLPAAAVLASKITLGLAGWIRHLPVSAAHHRRPAALAVVIALTPLLVVLAGLAFLPAGKNGTGEAVQAALGVWAAAAAAAIVVLPVRRPWWGDLIGLAACVLAGSGDLRLMGAGIAGTAAVDALSGPFQGRAIRVRRWTAGPSPLAFSFLQHQRAFGARLALPYLPAAAILGLTILLRANNPLPSGAAAAAIRFGAAASIGLLFTAAAALSAKRRPPWTWSRSLPVSSGRRIAADALFLAALALPLITAFVLLDWRAAAVMIPVLPFLSLRAAAALRPSPDSPRSPIPPFALEGLMTAAALALWPALAVLMVFAVPLAARAAVRRERSLKAGRWLELRFAAAGDSLSGSSS